jgi:hypothetical protein
MVLARRYEMKRSNGNPWLSCSFLIVALVFGVLPSYANAASYTNDFSSDIGAASLEGDAVLDSGSIRLTDSINSQLGMFFIDDLTPGSAISSFTATFDLQIGPGSTTPADGVSFTFGPYKDQDFGEEGLWPLLTVSFDTYDNGDPDHIGIDVKWHNAFLATSFVNPFTDGVFVPVSVIFHPDGTLDVTFDGNPVFTNLQTGFPLKVGDRFRFGARTGASNSVQRIDNVRITVQPPVTMLDPIPTLHPFGLAILVVLLMLLTGFVVFRQTE